jgi:hypothetical protein
MMLERIIGWVKAYPDYRNLPRIAVEESARGSLKESVVLVGIAQLASFVSISSAIIIASPSLLPAGGSLSAAILDLLKLSVVGLFLFYVISGMFYASARLLGGKGSFGRQSYVLAAFSLCNNLFSAPFTLFSQVPQMGGYLQAIVLVIGLYGIYAQYHGIKAAHGLSTMRAALAMAGTWLVLMLLTALVISALSKGMASTL